MEYTDSIKVVLFDWGGVLSVGGTPDELSRLFSDVLPYDAATIRDLTGPLFGELKRGFITPEGFWKKLSLQTGLSFPSSHRDVWATKDSLQPNQALKDFTETLKARGYRIGILSNVFPNTAEMIKNEGWYDPYDPVFLSCDLGLAKPDTAIYEHVIKELGVNPSEILFIDDQQKCLNPAASLGLHSILAVSPDQIIDEVTRKLGI